MEDSPKFAVFGGGSWATAIVKMLCENLEHVGWYMRNVDAIKHIKKEQHNPNYLSAVEFNTDKLKLSNDINEMVAYADYLIFVIPSAFIHQELEKLKTSLDGKVIISAIKGIVPESSLIVGEHFNTYFNVAFDDIGVISGPCHAEEVALERQRPRSHGRGWRFLLPWLPSRCPSWGTRRSSNCASSASS